MILILLYKVVLHFESVDEILKYDFASADEILKYDHS